MFVDAEGDDVYKWGVELSMFSPTSPLSADIAEIQV